MHGLSLSAQHSGSVIWSSTISVFYYLLYFWMKSLYSLCKCKFNYNSSQLPLNLKVCSGLWPLTLMQPDLHPNKKCQVSNNTHMSPPSGSVLPQAQLMFRQHGWRGRQRQSTAMLLGQLQCQLHTHTHTDSFKSSRANTDRQHADTCAQTQVKTKKAR